MKKICEDLPNNNAWRYISYCIDFSACDSTQKIPITEEHTQNDMMEENKNSER